MTKEIITEDKRYINQEEQIETPEQFRERIREQSISKQNLRTNDGYKGILGPRYIVSLPIPGVDRKHRLVSTSSGRMTYVPSDLAQRYRKFCDHITSIHCNPKPSQEKS